MVDEFDLTEEIALNYFKELKAGVFLQFDPDKSSNNTSGKSKMTHKIVNNYSKDFETLIHNMVEKFVSYTLKNKNVKLGRLQIADENFESCNVLNLMKIYMKSMKEKFETFQKIVQGNRDTEFSNKYEESDKMIIDEDYDLEKIERLNEEGYLKLRNELISHDSTDIIVEKDKKWGINSKNAEIDLIISGITLGDFKTMLEALKMKDCSTFDPIKKNSFEEKYKDKKMCIAIEETLHLNTDTIEEKIIQIIKDLFILKAFNFKNIISTIVFNGPPLDIQKFRDLFTNSKIYKFYEEVINIPIYIIHKTFISFKTTEYIQNYYNNIIDKSTLDMSELYSNRIKDMIVNKKEKMELESRILKLENMIYNSSKKDYDDNIELPEKLEKNTSSSNSILDVDTHIEPNEFEAMLSKAKKLFLEDDTIITLVNTTYVIGQNGFNRENLNRIFDNENLSVKKLPEKLNFNIVLLGKINDDMSNLIILLKLKILYPKSIYATISTDILDLENSSVLNKIPLNDLLSSFSMAVIFNLEYVLVHSGIGQSTSLFPISKIKRPVQIKSGDPNQDLVSDIILSRISKENILYKDTEYNKHISLTGERCLNEFLKSLHLKKLIKCKSHNEELDSNILSILRKQIIKLEEDKEIIIL
jgi:hypothetical protein